MHLHVRNRRERQSIISFESKESFSFLLWFEICFQQFYAKYHICTITITTTLISMSPWSLVWKNPKIGENERKEKEYPNPGHRIYQTPDTNTDTQITEPLSNYYLNVNETSVYLKWHGIIKLGEYFVSCSYSVCIFTFCFRFHFCCCWLLF